MSAIKIIRWVALVFAVVAAFVTIPYAALAMVILGLLIGFMGVPEERQMMFLVIAVALAMVAGALGAIPVVGEYLTAILNNFSAIVSAGAVAVILTIMWSRLQE